MKAQFFSSDMAAAVLVFSVTIAIIMLAWNSSVDRTMQDAQRRDMEATAARILDLLVTTPGYPPDWENSNASVIGIAESDRKISASKLNAFMGMGYTETKEIFGTHHDYFFKLGNYTKGVNGSGVYLRRMVIFNGTQFAELTLSK